MLWLFSWALYLLLAMRENFDIVLDLWSLATSNFHPTAGSKHKGQETNHDKIFCMS